MDAARRTDIWITKSLPVKFRRDKNFGDRGLAEKVTLYLACRPIIRRILVTATYGFVSQICEKLVKNKTHSYTTVLLHSKHCYLYQKVNFATHNLNAAHSICLLLSALYWASSQHSKNYGVEIRPQRVIFDPTS